MAIHLKKKSGGTSTLMLFILGIFALTAAIHACRGQQSLKSAITMQAVGPSGHTTDASTTGAHTAGVLTKSKNASTLQEHTTAALLAKPKNASALHNSSTMANRSKETKLDLDATSTSIIITSSWIPTHPSTIMLDRVVESCFKYLKGISPTVPIYIAVDMLPDKSKTPEKLNQLAQYIANLETRYANQSNIIIAPQDVHRHLSGMINHTLPLIKTKYLYVLQHDFPFARDVDHGNLVKSMEEYPEYLRCVRFNYKLWNRHPPCLDFNKEGSTPADHVNGLDLYSSMTWSDK
jgi:hypothetical protein